MRSVIGEVEVAPYLYPKLMVDRDGYIFFMVDDGRGFVVNHGMGDGLPSSFEYHNNYGPLKDFHGTITLSNS